MDFSILLFQCNYLSEPGLLDVFDETNIQKLLGLLFNLYLKLGQIFRRACLIVLVPYLMLSLCVTNLDIIQKSRHWSMQKHL